LSGGARQDRIIAAAWVEQELSNSGVVMMKVRTKICGGVGWNPGNWENFLYFLSWDVWYSPWAISIWLACGLW